MNKFKITSIAMAGVIIMSSCSDGTTSSSASINSNSSTSSVDSSSASSVASSSSSVEVDTSSTSSVDSSSTSSATSVAPQAHTFTFEEALGLKSSEIIKVSMGGDNYETDPIYETTDRAKIDKLVKDLSQQEYTVSTEPPNAGGNPYATKFYTDEDSFKMHTHNKSFSSYNIDVGLSTQCRAVHPDEVEAILIAFYEDLKASN